MKFTNHLKEVVGNVPNNISLPNILHFTVSSNCLAAFGHTERPPWLNVYSIK